MSKIPLTLLCALSFLSLVSCSSKSKEDMDKEAKVLTEAYNYGFPLMLMDMTRRVSTNVTSPDPQKIRAPINQFVHAVKFPDAEFKDVVRPNVDTLYSTAWLDLKQEPMILELPDTEGRYYLMPMLDGWTNIYSSPGKRTTGTGKQKLVIVGPNWKGNLPVNVPAIHSPTNITWIIGRTQTNNAIDATTTVAKIQTGYKLYPLSYTGREYTSPAAIVNIEQPMGPPVEQVFALSTEEYFRRLNKLMENNPPANVDGPVLKRFKKYHIGPDEKFVVDSEDRDELKRINAIPAEMRARYEHAKMAVVKPVNGWMSIKDIGSYATDYNKRAMVAYIGLGANLDADALYSTAMVDGQGDELNGNKQYILHFEKEEIPKVQAFWSLTVYGSDYFLVKNAIGRYALGDRDKLTYNKDGSLDIYLQNTSPGAKLESNWLPTPAFGKFDVTARMYWPMPATQDANYTLPPIMPRIKSEVTER